MKKSKEEHKHRIALTLVISFFVFLIIAIAAVLSVTIVYIFFKLDILESVEGGLKSSDLFLLIPVISTIIGFLITFLLSKITLRPFNRMIDQLNELASGNFKTRIEFGKPVSALPSFKEIESSFNKAAEELEHTEMLRSDFINNFSHEFKTPIVSIVGFAKLLKNGNLTNEEKAEYISIIEEESLRLSYMATNVLDLTKVENQTILTNISTYNLSEQIRSAILLLNDKAVQKNINYELEFDEHMISANEELLKQVWINLIDNAIKFSESDGTITVTIKEATNDITVSVSNFGKEIPEESLARIFNKFYQADESHSSDGNGIGLAIVKKVTELHNGDVLVESGGGKTTFTVRLPKEQD